MRESNVETQQSNQVSPQEHRQPSSQQAGEPSQLSEAEVRLALHLLGGEEQLHLSKEAGELQQVSRVEEEQLLPGELQGGGEDPLLGELQQAGEDQHLEPSQPRETPW